MVELLTPNKIADMLIEEFNEHVNDAILEGKNRIFLTKNEYGGKWPEEFIDFLENSGYIVTNDEDDPTVYSISWCLKFK